MNSRLSVSNFFQSLRSARRLRYLREVAEHVRQQVDHSQPTALDPLAPHIELKDFAVYASDGHYEKPGCHAQKIEGDKQPSGCFFSINLRSQSLCLLDIARPA